MRVTELAVQYGVHLPLISFAGEHRSLADLVAFAGAARDHGYDYLCANDHLVFARPWLDGPTALAAVLAHSGTLRLATTVAIATVRGPAATAKTLAALDLLSAGRLVAGIGPGSSARDYQLAGLDFGERWKRLDETVHALRAYWSGTTFEGVYYSTAGVRLEPRPAQRPAPPIWLGSWGSAAGLRRVARIADGWLASAYNTTPEAFARAWSDLRQHLAATAATDRPFPNAIATMWTYVTDDSARADAVLANLLAPMLNRPAHELRGQLLVGPPEGCAATLSAYAAAGAQRVFLWPVADELDQLRLFQERVAPLVAATAP